MAAVTRLVAGVIAVIILLTGCYIALSPVNPMPVVRYQAEDGQANGLIVLLPGFRDNPERFEQKGFVDIIRRIAPSFDIVAADAHFAYYRNHSIVDHLYKDVVGPELARYQRIWIVGISMGGAGAASYAMEHPQGIERVILLAPYLGDEEIGFQVKAAGGLRQWQPPELTEIEDLATRHFYKLWSWFKQYSQSASQKPVLMLGFGLDDRLSPANQLLADILPAEQVERVDGGHKWTVWRPIFEELLQRSVRAEVN